jgi:hypothetical protein
MIKLASLPADAIAKTRAIETDSTSGEKTGMIEAPESMSRFSVVDR